MAPTRSLREERAAWRRSKSFVTASRDCIVPSGGCQIYATSEARRASATGQGWRFTIETIQQNFSSGAGVRNDCLFSCPRAVGRSQYPRPISAPNIRPISAKGKSLFSQLSTYSNTILPPSSCRRRPRISSLETDIRRSCHRDCSAAGSGVKFILIPRVFKIVRTFPISRVSLPCSRSMIYRIPVPEVIARSLCDPQLLARLTDPFAHLGCGVLQNNRTGRLQRH